jgi:hypothetical protein
LRVWEREDCALHAMGGDTPGLLGPVCWQPNGRHIYAAQECSGEQRVALFERNGLAHGSFATRTQCEIAHRYMQTCFVLVIWGVHPSDVFFHPWFRSVLCVLGGDHCNEIRSLQTQTFSSHVPTLQRPSSPQW